MQIAQLIAILERMPAHTPLSDKFERSLERPGRKKPWYESQKEHALGWLREYHTEGAYGRRPSYNRDAEYFWNHLQCLGMMIWIAEVAGVRRRAIAHVVARTKPEARAAAACARFRQLITWSAIQQAMGGNVSGAQASAPPKLSPR